MNYCPECGKRLEHTKEIEERDVKVCTCGYIDWDNWVNVSAVTVAYNAQGKILMVRMKKTGKLTFPGGYRNIGETFIEAAKRECLEESGYIVDDLELFDVYTLYHLRLVWIVFKAKIIAGSFVDNEEVSEAIFVAPKQMIDAHDLRGSLTIRLLNKIHSQ